VSAALEIRNVSLSLRGTPVLENVDLTLEGGEFVGLIGPNGAGKTALLKVILGLLHPDRGSVRVFGEPPERARGRVAYVPQFARFDSEFPIRVVDVVLMGRLGPERLFRRFRREDRRRAAEALERVDLTPLADRQIGKLSGGQLQRVLIARALVKDARLLLLDEPTASLDTRVGIELYEFLARFSREMTVVMVSHDVGVIRRYVTSVACLNRRLFYHGSSAIPQETLDAAYGSQVEFLEHPHTHRILHDHREDHPS
jgi:zinc transport system ATP-binding protein